MQIEKVDGSTLASRIPICIVGLTLLTGCGSIGTQYVPPSNTQPSGTLVPQDGRVFISTHDENGCYQGRTELGSNKEFRLWPKREVVLVYELEGIPSRAAYPIDDSFCRAAVSFVPQEGERYTIKSTWIRSTRDSDGKLMLGSCGASVSRDSIAGAPEPVVVKRLVLRKTGIACITMVER